MSQLKVNSIIPVGGVPTGGGGGIIQIKQTFKNDTTSIANNSQTSFVDMAGMSVAITPTSTSSKILIIFTVNVSAESTNRNNSIRLMRDSTEIGGGTGGSVTSPIIYVRTIDDDIIENKNAQFLDSPNTTSEITYKLQWCAEGSGGSAKTWYLNRRAVGTFQITGSHITAIEVSA
tara:strand:+ start:1943 stop:2467 length:525 start_codon:yes stop_codon:yes gene_type:complete